MKRRNFIINAVIGLFSGKVIAKELFKKDVQKAEILKEKDCCFKIGDSCDTSGDTFLKDLESGIEAMRKQGVGGPYTLIIPEGEIEIDGEIFKFDEPKIIEVN